MTEPKREPPGSTLDFIVGLIALAGILVAGGCMIWLFLDVAR